MIQSMFRFFGIDFKTHLPGNPGAKGKVERMIGVHKRKYESQLRGIAEQIQSIDQYNMFMQAQAKEHNKLKGRDLLFKANLKNPFVPTQTQLRDSITSSETRTIIKQGEIQYKNKYYHVSHELYKGDKVAVYKNYKGDIFVETKEGQIYKADPQGCHEAVIFDQYKSYPKSTTQLRQEEAIAEGKKLKNMITFPDLIPKDDRSNQNKIIQVPLKGRRPKTKSLTPQDTYQTAEEVWLFILENTGFKRAELPETFIQAIDHLIEASLEFNKKVTAKDVLLITNKIREEITKPMEEKTNV